uniref:Uncharacterized protein n=1 Tax=viral metagenome TaxID=1070528 RepID=A0A6C0ATT0_9ZZZZ
MPTQGYIQFNNPIQFQFKLYPTANAARKINKPLFSNNSQVYYKPGSYPSGGVGTVRNSGVKGRRT